MAVVQASTVVNTTPEAIEEFARYADSWPQWFTGVVGAQADGSYPNPGSNVYVTFQGAGINFDVTMNVTEYYPGQQVSYALSGMVNGTLTFYTEAVDGGYQITAYIDYTLPGGVIGQAADAAVVQNMVQSNFTSAMTNLYHWVHG